MKFPIRAGERESFQRTVFRHKTTGNVIEPHKRFAMGKFRGAKQREGLRGTVNMAGIMAARCPPNVTVTFSPSRSDSPQTGIGLSRCKTA